jgi:glyoxylate/hydroxypyruvate reductase
MNILLAGDLAAAEFDLWHRELARALPHDRVLRARHEASAESIEAAVVANPPAGSLQGLPSLRLIQSLWAGVDRLLADPSLPHGVPIARMVDPAMTEAMVQTALWATLALHRGFFAYAQRQREQVWRVHAQRRADELRVAVLGLGEMGRAVAARLAAQGYRVSSWRTRGARRAGAGAAPGVSLAEGAPAFLPLLAESDIVINLLPLTEATRGLLDARAFAAMPRHAGLVNLARGAHLVDADLLAALDSGHLRHAVLDVFTSEPLPHEHRFWSHPQVTVLPHAAALTDPRSAAGIVAANMQALREGRAPSFLVDRSRGY